MNTPVHKHDCDCCIYLDTQEYNLMEDNKSPVDLYVCKQGDWPTVIGRFGIDGDYMSGLEFVKGRVKNIKTDQSNLEKVVELTKDKELSLTVLILANATKIAMERNHLNDDFTFNEPKTKLKIK